MTRFRHLSVVVLVLVLVSCGRQLPDATPAPPRPTATAVEATDSDTTEATPPPEIVVDDSADEMIGFVANADAANGQTLFNEPNSTGFACSNCHNAQNEQRLIGPGLYNIPSHAATRIEGQVAQRYIYNSIMHPNDYIVEGDPAYLASLMPQNYSEVYSEAQVYDIVAYLMTLGDAPVQTASTDTEAVEEATEEATEEVIVEAQPTEAVVEEATEAVEPTQIVEPTAVVEPTEAVEPTAVVEYSAEDARLSRLLSVGNEEFGERLYGEALVDEATCAACHATDNADTGEDGPGLLGVAQSIASANPDVPVNVAIYNAILNSDSHGDLYTTYVEENSFLDLANIIAYVMTLGDEEEAQTDATTNEQPQETTADDPNQAVIDAVMAADAAHGEELFNAMNASGFACSTCHSANSDARLIGPGLLGIPSTAETRVEGDPAIIYLWHSIITPNAYIVEGEPPYPESLMPQNYTEIFSDEDIYDIIAYLLTLDE